MFYYLLNTVASISHLRKSSRNTIYSKKIMNETPLKHQF